MTEPRDSVPRLPESGEPDPKPKKFTVQTTQSLTLTASVCLYAYSAEEAVSFVEQAIRHRGNTRSGPSILRELNDMGIMKRQLLMPDALAWINPVIVEELES